MQTTTTHLARRLARPLADVHARRALAIVLLPLVLALVGALSSARSTPQAPPATLAPIIILATPTAAPADPSPIGPPSRALVARWDYRDAASATAIESADIVRVAGRADDWRLVALTTGAQVWLFLADVPIGTAAASEPLTDLAPPPTPVIIFVEVPAPIPPAAIEGAGVRIQTTTAPECWAGPPAIYQPGQDRCWAGVPYVAPGGTP